MTWGSAPWRIAAAFASITADMSEEGVFFAYSGAMEQLPFGDVLPTLQRVSRSNFFGGGTDTTGAVLTAYQRHRDAQRIVLVTDEQAFGASSTVRSGLESIPIPIYTWNVGGYAPAWQVSGANRYSVGGLSDAGFTLIEALEGGADAGWPWQE